jgi:hypothetical protein
VALLESIRRHPRTPATFDALVAQGIEHAPPERGAQVRILPRALTVVYYAVRRRTRERTVFDDEERRVPIHLGKEDPTA